MILKRPARTAASVITLLLVPAAALFLAPGCANYHGPTIGSVGLTGSYSDKEGDTYGGGVNLGLAYPTPTPSPTPTQKPIDHSK